MCCFLTQLYQFKYSGLNEYSTHRALSTWIEVIQTCIFLEMENVEYNPYLLTCHSQHEDYTWLHDTYLRHTAFISTCSKLIQTLGTDLFYWELKINKSQNKQNTDIPPLHPIEGSSFAAMITTPMPTKNQFRRSNDNVPHIMLFVCRHIIQLVSGMLLPSNTNCWS